MKLIFYELYKLFKVRIIAVLSALLLVFCVLSGALAKMSDFSDDFIKFINESVSAERPLGIAVNYALNEYDGAKPEFEEGLRELGQYGIMANYQGKIKDRITNLENQKTLSVFDPTGFIIRNSDRYIEKYNELIKAVDSREYIPFGVELLTKNNTANLLLLFFILLSAFFIGFSDKLSGASFLVFTTQNGRGKTALAKVGALFIICCFSVIVISVSLLFIGDIRFSLGDLSRSVQSLSGFFYSTINVTVIEYILMFIAEKIFSMFLFGLIILVLSAVFRSAAAALSVAVIIGSVESLLFYLIPETSGVLLSRLNIISLYETNAAFSAYDNLNLLGYPIEVYSALIYLLCALIPLNLAAYIMLFCKQKSIEGKSMAQIKKILSLSDIFKIKKSSKLLLHEISKTMFSNKAFLVIVITAALSFIYYSTLSLEYSPADARYKSYIDSHGGEVTEETLDFINREGQYFDDLILKQDIALKSENYNEYIKITKELETFSGYERFAKRAAYIYENPELRLIYETGYERLFSDNVKNTTISLIAVFALMLLVLPMYSSENKNGLIKLINSTPNGRARLYILRSVISAFLAIPVFLAAYIPDILFVFKNYDMSGGYARLSSLEIMSEQTVNITLSDFIALNLTVKFISLIFCAELLLFISFTSGNYIIGLVKASAILLLPLGLSLILPVFGEIWLTPYLCGNILTGFALQNLVASVMICAAAVILRQCRTKCNLLAILPQYRNQN